MIGDEVLVGEDLHGGGAGVVAAVKPPLDAAAVVGDAGAEADGGFHHVERDGTPEVTRNGYTEIVPHHFGDESTQ